jgi:hypothetical protein
MKAVALIVVLLPVVAAAFLMVLFETYIHSLTGTGRIVVFLVIWVFVGAPLTWVLLATRCE